MEDVQLIFKSFDVTKVLLDRGDDGLKDGKYEVNIRHTSHLSEENKNIYKAIFLVNISGKGNPFSLQVEAMGVFEIVGKPEKGTRDNFITISSPAIIYPYIRAFISNLTLQLGMKPIIVPTIYFGGKEKKEMPEQVTVKEETKKKKA